MVICADMRARRYSGRDDELALAGRELPFEKVEQLWISIDFGLAALALRFRILVRLDPDDVSIPVDLLPCESVDLVTSKAGGDGKKHNLEKLRLRGSEIAVGLLQDDPCVDLALVAVIAGAARHDPVEWQGCRQSQ